MHLIGGCSTLGSGLIAKINPSKCHGWFLNTHDLSSSNSNVNTINPPPQSQTKSIPFAQNTFITSIKANTFTFFLIHNFFKRLTDCTTSRLTVLFKPTPRSNTFLSSSSGDPLTISTDEGNPERTQHHRTWRQTCQRKQEERLATPLVENEK